MAAHPDETKLVYKGEILQLLQLVVDDNDYRLMRGLANGSMLVANGQRWRAAINTTVAAGKILITVPAVAGQEIVVDSINALGDNIFALITIEDEVPDEVMRFNVGAQNRWFQGGDLASTKAGDAMAITLTNLVATGLLCASGRYV
ncbi:MAG: hypothetical protein ACR2O6_00720 [Ilumatobacteraceae bacterium]